MMKCLRKVPNQRQFSALSFRRRLARAMPVAGQWLFVPANTSMKRKPAHKATRKKRPDYGCGRQQPSPGPKRAAAIHRRTGRPSASGVLQTIHAAAGLADAGSARKDSRRAVEVERQVVTNWARASIRSAEDSGRRNRVAQAADRLERLNKPTGVVFTNRDPGGGRRGVDLVPSGERLFTVGRLT